MEIERFEIYRYENVFYTEEELEQMGFICMAGRGDFECLKENNPKYVLKVISDNCEHTYPIDEYLNRDDESLNGKFLLDYVDYGFVLDVEKLYGIRYKSVAYDKKIREQIQLFKSEDVAQRSYLNIESQINEMFGYFAQEVLAKYNDYTTEFIKQNKEKETRQRVLNLINKGNEESK